MKKSDLTKLIEALKDDENVDEVVSGSDLGKALKTSGLTLDSFKEKVASDKDFKAYLDSEKDMHHNKALKTWQDNNLQKLVDEEVKKRFPDADPKDTKIKELELKFEKMQKEATHKDLTNKALKTLTEKKLPTDLVNFIVGKDEDDTNKNLETLTNIFSAHDEAIKTEILKNTSYTPPGGIGGGNSDKLGKSEVEKMTNEIAQYFN